MAMLIYGQPMKAVYNPFNHNRVRLSFLLSLIFFGLCLIACRQNNNGEITIIWSDKQAIGLSIPRSLLKEGDDISSLKIRLEKKEDAMLGEFKQSGDYIVFESLVPLSPGLSYEILFKNNFLSKVTIPFIESAEAPTLVAIYPSADTLPENLLKIYFQFSTPMRESESLQHISLSSANGDTLDGTFLDLRPELWNKERTVLTVWLDPGRIKRDLIPNQKLGNPLKKGNWYSVNISDRWKDASNRTLLKGYTKKILVADRDSLSPQPQQWKINPPVAGSAEPVTINTNEALDYFLLGETIKVINDKGSEIAGKFKIEGKETYVEFTPNVSWQAGNYRLRIASYLEDLAGNNLQRLFDRDVNLNTEKKSQDFVDVNFTITVE
jgi:hypothetical protein